jgi:hypothetical protein
MATRILRGIESKGRGYVWLVNSLDGNKCINLYQSGGSCFAYMGYFHRPRPPGWDITEISKLAVGASIA